MKEENSEKQRNELLQTQALNKKTTNQQRSIWSNYNLRKFKTYTSSYDDDFTLTYISRNTFDGYLNWYVNWLLLTIIIIITNWI